MTKSDVTALYFFSARQRQSPNPEDLTCELVAGEECIHEELLGLEFRISPYYFFQGVRKVIGIEMFQETEKDAKVNDPKVILAIRACEEAGLCGMRC
ncbi:tRNA (uracil-5-)-methyltransferase homolog A-like isoform X2 [Oncorhynchus masou masou]|uniref:tRNA (uracil-5-)-methyltransferase homolog A-like isoform X2 n=1 Tax=Oncorhynchus masou masou TaxID=90313 RepID=UPI003183ED15